MGIFAAFVLIIFFSPIIVFLSVAEGQFSISQDPKTSHAVKEMVQKNWSCDIRKTRSMVGYGPKIDVTQGREIAVEWRRRNNWL